MERRLAKINLAVEWNGRHVCYYATAWTPRSVTKTRWSQFCFSLGARSFSIACRNCISLLTSPLSFISVVSRLERWLPFWRSHGPQARVDSRSVRLLGFVLDVGHGA